ncbi:MAG TPA: RsmD family RNA methyltransferase [Patescibacteria group bacterium]|nr:RsmD family RNA methyltransferase [Patescibacteria group bacterium]
MSETIELEFDRFTPTGMAASATTDARGRTALAWGVFPGERARVAPIRVQQGNLLCRVEEILAASPNRIPPREGHYLSCSPWQTMHYAAQVRWKRQILESLFPHVPLGRFVPAETIWGYRNKLEFNFTEDGGRLHLAFHERASRHRKLALPEGCRLAGETMNAAALEMVEHLNARGIGASSLKSLVVRGGAATGEVLIALYVMEERLADLNFQPERSAGLAIIYSDPLSPASVPTKILARRGPQQFTARVGGLELACPLEGFFQNHAEVFACAIAEIRRYVPPAARVLELYSGVGSIGLALCDLAGEIIAVESNQASVAFAERNRRSVGAENYRPVWAQTESCAEQLLDETDVVLMDPPRSGLPARLVAALARTRPGRIIYLACNPVTQSRDIALLGSGYRPVALAGFDFYPQTPHMESLVVLDRA